MTKFNLLAIINVCLIIAAVSIVAPYLQSPSIDAVLNGDALLACHMHDGFRIIDTHKIVEFHEGVWYFEDSGYAKQCRIIRGYKD